METSLVCLQEQEDFHSHEGHQELAKMWASGNSHSEIQSWTGAAFQDQGLASAGFASWTHSRREVTSPGGTVRPSVRVSGLHMHTRVW